MWLLTHVLCIKLTIDAKHHTFPVMMFPPKLLHKDLQNALPNATLFHTALFLITRHSQRNSVAALMFMEFTAINMFLTILKYLAG